MVKAADQVQATRREGRGKGWLEGGTHGDGASCGVHGVKEGGDVIGAVVLLQAVEGHTAQVEQGPGVCMCSSWAGCWPCFSFRA